jgi:hypothetical protein
MPLEPRLDQRVELAHRHVDALPVEDEGRRRRDARCERLGSAVVDLTANRLIVIAGGKRGAVEAEPIGNVEEALPAERAEVLARLVPHEVVVELPVLAGRRRARGGGCRVDRFGRVTAQEIDRAILDPELAAGHERPGQARKDFASELPAPRALVVAVHLEHDGSIRRAERRSVSQLGQPVSGGVMSGMIPLGPLGFDVSNSMPMARPMTATVPSDTSTSGDRQRERVGACVMMARGCAIAQRARRRGARAAWDAYSSGCSRCSSWCRRSGVKGAQRPSRARPSCTFEVFACPARGPDSPMARDLWLRPVPRRHIETRSRQVCRGC